MISKLRADSSLLLRWSIGDQDTVFLRDFATSQKFQQLIWLTKLSIRSFQNWFDADFVVLYNGNQFEQFLDIFNKSSPSLLCDCLIIDQNDPTVLSEKFRNPYHFHPTGVWYKWIPFRFDSSKTEISIDTDVICISDPITWKSWIKEGKNPILIAPERFRDIRVNTCGDLFQHEILRNKPPCNCGIVGHQKGFDFSDRFFEVTTLVDPGSSHNSLFITEQGAINVWLYSLECEGTKHYLLDFEKNSWLRDCLYYISRGVQVETVHATTWHKKIAWELRDVFEDCINNKGYDCTDFLSAVLKSSKKLRGPARQIIEQQMHMDSPKKEFYFDPSGSV